MATPTVEQYVATLVQTLLPGNAGRAIDRQMDLVTDLNADSMSLVSLIFALDEKFAIGTDEMGDMVRQCRTVGDLIDAAERLRAAHQSN